MTDNIKPIEQRVVELLKKKKLFISTAESCTGGLIGAAIVNVNGASSVYHEGYITYSNEAKIKLLGVSPRTLAVYKAVSKETAFEMCEGGAARAGSDICIAVTGVAGPNMEDDKPVGLVYIGCYYNGKEIVKEFNFKGTRQEIRNQAVEQGLQLILDIVKE